MSGPTPGPWDYVGGYIFAPAGKGVGVATAFTEADAERIVRACNSHDELLAACKDLLGLLQLLSYRSDVSTDLLVHLKSGPRIEAAYAAIARATGAA